MQTLKLATQQFVTLLLLATFTLPSVADDGSVWYQQGLNHYSANAPDHGRAFELFGQAARAGYPRAQYQYGLMYQRGEGVNRDYAKALHWYKLAAGHGLGIADHHIAQMYQHGHGVRPSYQHAIYWYSRSISHGYEAAVNPLEEIYRRNYGLTVNLAQSGSLLEKIADGGDPTSQYNLGYKYYIGHEVGKDPAVAAMWFLRAAEQGDGDAQYMLGKMYHSGEGLDQSYDRCYFWSTLANFTQHEEADAIRSLCVAEIPAEKQAALDQEIDAKRTEMQDAVF